MITIIICLLIKGVQLENVGACRVHKYSVVTSAWEMLGIVTAAIKFLTFLIQESIAAFNQMKHVIWKLGIPTMVIAKMVNGKVRHIIVSYSFIFLVTMMRGVSSVLILIKTVQELTTRILTTHVQIFVFLLALTCAKVSAGVQMMWITVDLILDIKKSLITQV